MKLAGLAAALAVSVLGCAPGSETSTGEEETATVQPGQEQGTEQAEDPAAEPVAVDLPGLPIGGSGVDFVGVPPQEQCVQVSWTAASLAEGVAVEIRGFGVPAGFTTSTDPCGTPPCLDGFRFTATSTGCHVLVTWQGSADETAPAAGQLVVTDARLTCVDEVRCSQALAVIQAVGAAGVGLLAVPSTNGSAATGETS